MSYAGHFVRLIHAALTTLWLKIIFPAATAGAPALSYAGLAPAQGAKSSGGRLKLRTLAAAFPERSGKGNILYLVTSALPTAAVARAKVAKARGWKVVLNQNGVAFPAWASPAVMEKVNARNRHLLDLADAVVYQSQFCRAATDKWVGAHSGLSMTIYNPVDTELFRRKQDPSKGRILVLGSHAQPERVMLALAALRLGIDQGDDWYLTVAGPFHWAGADGAVEAEITRLKLEGRVRLFGRYSSEQQARLLNEAEVLVHLQDKDASPTVPLEALACEVPVVALASGGVPELVNDECARLLSVDGNWDRYGYPSADAIVVAIREAAGLGREGGEAGRKLVEARFSAKIFKREHTELFERLAVAREARC